MSDSSRPTVLVVEDESSLASVYESWLSSTYAVRTAGHAEAALSLLDDAVDVVLLDRRLPERSGADLLTEIRASDHDPRVVMVTAVEPDFDVVEMPFDDYLVKPVTGADLRDAVERMLARAAYEAGVRRYFALASKRATLDAQTTAAERRASPEYDALLADLREAKAAADDVLDEFEDDDFAAAFSRLVAEGSQ